MQSLCAGALLALRLKPKPGPVLQEALSKAPGCHSAALRAAAVHAYTSILLSSHDVPTTHIPLGLLH